MKHFFDSNTISRIIEEVKSGSLDPDAQDKAFKATCRSMVSKVSSFADTILSTINLVEVMHQHSGQQQLSPENQEVIDKLDETLALMARNLSTCIHIRGAKTRNSELLFHIYGETLGNLERFESIWQRCITKEEDINCSDSPGYWMLSALTKGVQLFEAECERRPNLFRFWAQAQPCLPMLVFKHKAAYRKRFSRLAEATELGQRCPINVSSRANYSLETPINGRVFSILIDYMDAHDWITFVRSSDPEIAWRKGATIEVQLIEQARLPSNLVPVFLQAYDLPPLAKETAQTWADTYIIPYLHAENADYFNATEFATIHKRKRVKSPATAKAEIRKDIIRALVGMARPSSPKHRKSSAKAK